MQPSFVAKPVAIKPAVETDWANLETPPWGADPQGPGPVGAPTWDTVPPNPLAKASAPPRPGQVWDGILPGPPGSRSRPTIDPEDSKNWIRVEMSDLESRKAARAETMVQPQPKVKAAVVVGAEAPVNRSAASLKRARQKEAKEQAAKLLVPEYIATGMPGSSNGLRPQTPEHTPAPSDGDDDAEERELLAKMEARGETSGPEPVRLCRARW